jgi:hypothetical protein
MHFPSLCVVLAVLAGSLPCHAFSRKPLVTVRFHTETNPQDGETFAKPIDLRYQRRSAYINRVPDFSEKQIKGIMPFDAGDGTSGCVFILDAQGRIRLEALSNERRGAALVVFIGTKTGIHQVVDFLIDRPVTDGTIVIPRGLTALEIAALRKQFKEIPSDTSAAAPEKPPESPGARGDRGWTPPPPPEQSKRRKTPEPDLPRLAD